MANWATGSGAIKFSSRVFSTASRSASAIAPFSLLKLFAELAKILAISFCVISSKKYSPFALASSVAIPRPSFNEITIAEKISSFEL